MLSIKIKWNESLMMKEIELKVEAMVCVGSENRVQTALKNIEGVAEVVASHQTKTVKITANENVSMDSLKEAIEDVGYEVIE